MDRTIILLLVYSSFPSLPCHQAQAPHQSGLLPGIGEEFYSLTCFNFSLDMKLTQPLFSGGNLFPGSGHHPIVQHTPPHYWQLFHLGRYNKNQRPNFSKTHPSFFAQSVLHTKQKNPPNLWIRYLKLYGVKSLCFRTCVCGWL